MKLRNKSTGEIVDTKDYNFKIATPAEPLYGHDAFDVREEYNSLAELNADWEDVEPAEPLIKDEKIRKAVRAWAEAVDADSAFVEKWAYDGDQFVLSDELAEIHFRIKTPKEIKSYKRYTIAELCGEESP